MPKFHPVHIPAILLGLFILCVGSPYAQAQNMTQFNDEDGIFHVLIPENYKINKKMTRIDNSQMVISTEIHSVVDQRPYKEVVKDFIVKYDQSFMNAIPQEDIPKLLEKDLEKYINYYAKFDGVLRKREVGTFGGQPGGEIIISYLDKEKGIQSIRLRIVYTDVTRVEQIIIGPEDAITAQSTTDYFSSLSVKGGRTSFPGEIEKEWDTLVSPFALFTQLLPKRTIPYVPNDPQIASNDRVERVSLKLVDPVYENIMFYNIYGYRFNSLMTMDNVQKVILDRHLKKFNVNIRNVQFTQTSAGDYPVLATKVHFAAPDRYPYMNTIDIKAHYYGNFVVIQELAGNNAHVESVLAHNLTRMFKFYPMRGHKQFTAEKAGHDIKKLKNQAAAATQNQTQPTNTDTEKAATENAQSETSSPASAAAPEDETNNELLEQDLDALQDETAVAPTPSASTEDNNALDVDTLAPDESIEDLLSTESPAADQVIPEIDDSAGQ